MANATMKLTAVAKLCAPGASVCYVYASILAIQALHQSAQPVMRGS